MNGIIIVVNFNQEPEISPFLEKLSRASAGLDVVVVDDGSTDASAEIAAQRGFTVLRHSHNQGVGAGIRTGIQHAQAHGYDYVVIMSSNGKMRPSEIGRVIAPLLDGSADYVQGSRFLRDGESVELSHFRRAAIPLFSSLVSVLLRQRFTDITCGFRAYKLQLFENPDFNIAQSWLDRYELEYYIHYFAAKAGARIVEVPVTIDYSHLDKGRQSKIVPLLGWWLMVRPFVYLTLRVKR